jgi:hypothetical protein
MAESLTPTNTASSKILASPEPCIDRPWFAGQADLIHAHAQHTHARTRTHARTHTHTGGWAAQSTAEGAAMLSQS